MSNPRITTALRHACTQYEETGDLEALAASIGANGEAMDGPIRDRLRELEARADSLRFTGEGEQQLAEGAKLCRELRTLLERYQPE